MNPLQFFFHSAYNGARPRRTNTNSLSSNGSAHPSEGRTEMITIGDVIRDREPYYVRDTANVLDAAEYMTSRNIGAVCVLDEEGKLTGIFSERDLLRRVVIVGKQAS